MEKILYVEDDLSLIDGLKYTLEKSGYLVDNARTVKEALAFYRQNKYDLLLLDVTLPDGSGFDICKEVRNQSTVPIIFLTASDEEINVVMGLDMGGDDYITKPFKLNELISRIKAILRRSTQFSKADSVLEANGIKVDTAERLVWKSGVLLELTLVEYKINLDTMTHDVSVNQQEVKLTRTEYAILKMLMQNPSQVIAKSIMLERISQDTPDCTENSLKIHVSNLRKKLREISGKDYIEAVWGIGFKFTAE